MSTEMISESISNTTILCLSISAILCFITPFLLLLFYRVKLKAKFAPFFIGAGVFILSVMVLESIFHSFFLGISPMSDFLNNNVLAYTLYGCLSAGIFEETGRFLAFRFLSKKYPQKQNALMYGAGHGGIEAIFVGGLGAVSTLILALTLNSIGLEAYLKMMPSDMHTQVSLAMNTLIDSPSTLYLASGVERLIAILFHTCMSVFVYFSVVKPNLKYLYPATILIHALFNVPAALYQKGIIQNILLLEVIILLFAGVVSVFTYRLYQSEKLPILSNKDS